MIGYFAAPDGRRLAFRDTGGEGPAVVCLAGLSRNGRDFDSLADHLAPRYRVVRLDSRGRGLSEYAEDPLTEYTVPVEAADAHALLDHLGIGACTIIGTSRGGILGMALASGMRGRIKALVLNDVGAVVEMTGLLRIMSKLGREPRADSFEEAAEDLAEVYHRDFPRVSHARWIRHAHAIYREVEGRPRRDHDGHLRSATAVALDTQLERITLWPLFEALGGLPILLIRGQNSDILSRGTVAEMRRLRPDMRYVEVEGRGHTPFLDEPEAVAAIDAFLEDHA